ncbi:hypothetical protein ACOME3_007083 [Neoechinorhynchus agilis]
MFANSNNNQRVIEIRIKVMYDHVYILLAVLDFLAALPTEERDMHKRESVVINLLKPAGSEGQNAMPSLPEVAINLIDPEFLSESQIQNFTNFDFGNDEQPLEDLWLDQRNYGLELTDTNGLHYPQYSHESGSQFIQQPITQEHLQAPILNQFPPTRQHQYFGPQPIIQPIVILIQTPVEEQLPEVPMEQRPPRVVMRPSKLNTNATQQPKRIKDI